jgi:Zn-dependent oligopeptidase
MYLSTPRFKLIFFAILIIILNQDGQKNSCDIHNINDLANLFCQNVDDVKRLVQKTKKQIISDLEYLKTCDNSETIYAYDKLLKNYARSHTVIKIVEMLNLDVNFQNQARDLLTDLEKFRNTQLSYNYEVYQKLKKAVVKDSLKNNLVEIIKNYELSGINLPQDQLAEIRKIILEINELVKNFENDATFKFPTIYLTEDEQKNLKESTKNLIKDNKLKLTDTVYSILLTNENESIRKKSWYADSNKAAENKNRLKEIIRLRQKLAKMLNYKNFAEYEIEDEMAKNSANVRSFLNQLTKPIQEKFKNEFNKLIENLPADVYINNGKINPWDIAYIQKKSVKKELNVKYHEYFEFNNTIKQIFKSFEDFLDIKIKRLNRNLFWDDEIITVEIFENNRSAGFILLDLFSRSNKYNSSFEMPIIPSTKDCKGAALVVINLQQKRVNEPYLLSIFDIATIYHEFGHAIHDILGKTELNILAGTKVDTDYLEMPSQVFQEWPYIHSMLKELSSHYKTGEKLSDDQIKIILDFSKHGNGFKYLYQIYYALIALDIFEFADTDPFKKDAEIFSRTIPTINYYQNYSLNSFVHLIDYNSKYYVYLWSKVFAMDILEKIKNNNFSKDIGKKFKEILLQPGGSEQPEILLKSFLEREPNINAFIESLS